MPTRSMAQMLIVEMLYLLQRYNKILKSPNILAIFRKFRTNGRVAVKYAILRGLSPLKTAILGCFCPVFRPFCEMYQKMAQSGETQKQRKPRAYGNPHAAHDTCFRRHR